MSETLFKQVNYDLGGLVKYIDIGEIGLPDIQRPFVWKNAKVRDLFDSMYRGYPVGYILFWQNGFSDIHKVIGTDEKQKVPRLLIVDGQQRLTSLYAVLKGIPVIRDNYAAESIRIAFNPLTERFEVGDAAIQRDKSYIADISCLWSDDTDLFEIVEGYLESLSQSREVSADERKRIQKAISRLQSLSTYPFTALELSSSIDEEQVSEVFVRINSQGKTLNQSDFILTLMSVFWDDGRKELEEFSRQARTPTAGRASPFNHHWQPGPDRLLRVSVGLAFKRARLQYVYSILRGKDLETEEFSDERREAQFELLKAAQARVLNLTYWHDFFNAIREAGFKSLRMISSENNVVFAYLLYLMGRTEFHIDEFVLRRAVARWFFMSSLTGRFTGSPESAMEFDLARFREVEDGDKFLSILRRICAETLTNDYWEITLPNDLATSASFGPALFGYYAALVLLKAHVLYSKQMVSDLLDPSVTANKSALERHHLFPKAYLNRNGISGIRDTNQIANFALVEWGDNVSISDGAPQIYTVDLENRFSESELEEMYALHALPEGWQTLDYATFLQRRRELIAGVIKRGFAVLEDQDASAAESGLGELHLVVKQGETPSIEFKCAIRTNLHTGKIDERTEWSVLRTIAGFLNQRGGTLIVGVTDDGEWVGLDADGFSSEEEMATYLVSASCSKMGDHVREHIHPRFEDHADGRILVIECWPATQPVRYKDENGVHFYIRSGVTTVELAAEDQDRFLAERFQTS
jgi:hypothetical protein